MIKAGGSILTLAELEALKELSGFAFHLGNRIREIDAPLNPSGVDSDAFIEKITMLGILTCVGSGTKGRIFQFRKHNSVRFLQTSGQPAAETAACQHAV